MWRSVPQMDAAWTRIRTSPSPGSGTGISTSSAPARGAVLRSARMDPGMRGAYRASTGTGDAIADVEGASNDQEERPMRLRLFGATVLSLGLLAAACANASAGDGAADGSTGGTTGSDGISYPTGADRVVLRIESGGGFVAM